MNFKNLSLPQIPFWVKKKKVNFGTLINSDLIYIILSAMLPKSKYMWPVFCLFYKVYHFFKQFLLRLLKSKEILAYRSLRNHALGQG